MTADSARSRQRLVSAACEKTYPHTPRLPNELINRRALTSVAAAARRNLFEAMLVAGHLENCGIEGYPPERSMYASLLKESGIHRQNDAGDWSFGAPDPSRDPALRAVWDTIERFLFNGSAELKARPVTELMDELRLPPFGVSEGMIPVLLCASLLYHADEILLYEDGAFVTGLDAATFERLAKRPEFFAVQGVRITGERAKVIARLAKGLLKPDEPQTVGRLVRALYLRVARLPMYSLRTFRVSKEAQAVRELLKEAREPERLLLVELPQAVGAEPLSDESREDDENTTRFFDGLNAALFSWFRAFPNLITRVNTTLFEIFGAESRDDLKERFANVQELIREPRLKALAARIADEPTDETKWVESVASAVHGRVPGSWTDSDEGKYSDALYTLLISLQSVELVAVAKAKFEGRETQIGAIVSFINESGTGYRIALNLPESTERNIQELADSVWDSVSVVIGNETHEVQLAVMNRVTKTLMRRSERQLANAGNETHRSRDGYIGRER